MPARQCSRSAERPDTRAVQPVGEGRRKRPPQIRPPQFGLQNAAPAHLEREAASDGLDLRKFGHSFQAQLLITTLGGRREMDGS